MKRWGGGDTGRFYISLHLYLLFSVTATQESLQRHGARSDHTLTNNLTAQPWSTFPHTENLVAPKYIVLVLKTLPALSQRIDQASSPDNDPDRKGQMVVLENAAKFRSQKWPDTITP